MPRSIRHSLVLLTLAASAAACGSREAHSTGVTATGGVNDNDLQPGASGTTDAGQGSKGGAGARGVETGGAELGGAIGTGGTSAGGFTSRPPNFLKTRLNAEFYSEGIYYGDLNRDGKKDIIAGPYWYPGPDYGEKRAFREPRATPFDVSGDSDCYTIFIYDLNQDGWLDVLSFRLAGGAEAVWYENSKGAGGYWVEHVAYSAVDNEAATFTDIDGDGKPELVTQSNGYGGWAEPNWTQPGLPLDLPQRDRQGHLGPLHPRHGGG